MSRIILVLLIGASAYMAFRIGTALVQPADAGPQLYEMQRNDIPIHDDVSVERITKRVNSLWDRIEEKMADFGPKTYETLRPPAKLEEIENLEARLGFTLAPGLRASLLRHDGSTDEFGVFQLLSVEEIFARHFRCARELAAENDFLRSNRIGHEEGMWDPGAITVGTAHFDLIVDVETEQALIVAPHNYSGPHSDRFEKVLEQMAIRLEQGRYEASDGKIWFNGFGSSNY